MKKDLIKIIKYIDVVNYPPCPERLVKLWPNGTKIMLELYKGTK